MQKKISLLLFLYVVIIHKVAFSEDQNIVQNLISTTHTINVSTSYTQIRFTWDEPSGDTVWDGYYLSFDQNSDTDFQLNAANTTGDPLPANERVINCSGNDDYYYVHVAPAVYSFETFDYIFGTTLNVGPYRIDTTPPSVILESSAYANSNPIDLTIGESGASYMCLSNTGFGDCQEWLPVDHHPQFNLSSGEGIKTIYVQVKDNAGNPANDTSTIMFDSIPPSATIDILPTKFENVFQVTVLFSEPVSELNVNDVEIVNGTASNFIVSEVYPNLKYTFDLTASDHGKGYVKINQNAVFDQSGNGNNMIRNSFVYCSRNVPTLNEWGLIIMFCILVFASFQRIKTNGYRYQNIS